ncbi:DUF6799 domain-containing protein [Hymenobacter sp. APR13]|uniref:DUF6799 domain-containing protein n=1 Tax=Hymenobacter sp. APR13 TaxID=1356852 RepID=UPI0004E0876A|nr:DUF6799 domain-containing protein [Hymenobacter sp. APR13]AII50960.1 hypothetical protein N008_03050 [Hymenobacter sp. APR13]
MKNPAFLAVAALLAVAAPHAGTAQTKTTPKTAAASTDQYVMHDAEVLLRQGTRLTPLTKNVVLPNGTKVNYKSGIVEFPTGKKTTLREGDYVTSAGDIVFATPASAAAARGDNSVPAGAQYTPYVQKGAAPTAPATTTVTAIGTPNDLTSLLTRKVQLLTEKISLMTPNPANQAAINSLNQQLQQLDAQIGR